MKAFDPSCSIKVLVDQGMEETVSGIPWIDEVLAQEQKEDLLDCFFKERDFV